MLLVSHFRIYENCRGGLSRLHAAERVRTETLPSEAANVVRPVRASWCKRHPNYECTRGECLSSGNPLVETDGALMSRTSQFPMFLETALGRSIGHMYLCIVYSWFLHLNKTNGTHPPCQAPASNQGHTRPRVQGRVKALSKGPSSLKGYVFKHKSRPAIRYLTPSRLP